MTGPENRARVEALISPAETCLTVPKIKES